MAVAEASRALGIAAFVACAPAIAGRGANAAPGCPQTVGALRQAARLSLGGRRLDYMPRQRPPLTFMMAPLIQSPEGRRRNRTASATGWGPPKPSG